MRMNENCESLRMEAIHIWRLVLSLIAKEDYSKAFELLFRLGDDIYFLRACILCGQKVVAKVHKRTAVKIIRKLSEIRVGNKLLSNNLSFIEKGLRNNVLDLVDHRTGVDTL